VVQPHWKTEILMSFCAPRGIIRPTDRDGKEPTSILKLQLCLIRSTLDLRLFVNNALDAHPLLQSSADAPGSLQVYAHTLGPRT